MIHQKNQELHKTVFMKKICSLFIGMFALLAASFANGPEIAQPVLRSFRSSFAEAKEVTWTEGSAYYTATFQLYGKTVTAFYHADGELMAVTRNMAVTELPTALRSALKAISGRWITEIFQVSTSFGTTCYAVLENADSKWILQSRGLKKWVPYQTAEKQ